MPTHHRTRVEPLAPAESASNLNLNPFHHASVPKTTPSSALYHTHSSAVKSHLIPSNPTPQTPQSPFSARPCPASLSVLPHSYPHHTHSIPPARTLHRPFLVVTNEKRIRTDRIILQHRQRPMLPWPYKRLVIPRHGHRDQPHGDGARFRCRMDTSVRVL